MGRAPCCEKMGLKRGPWSPDEDRILINFIQQNGHSNWRALPKKAGLLRCGKSCRLRWTNYLRPDIKRGDFSSEEEQAIIKFHDLLGNRWSAIAAKLPGRTDNEIKNVWHTHLKKRSLNQNHGTEDQIKAKKVNISSVNQPPCSSPISSVNKCNNGGEVDENTSQELGFSESFFEGLWQEEEVLEDGFKLESDIVAVDGGRPPQEVRFPLQSVEPISGWSADDTVDIMDFWSNVLVRDGEFLELQEII